MSATGKRRPNIVVVLADDLGWGDLGCYGAERIQTPNVDRLAEEGIRFTALHSASAVCTPSRYALLTGRYCWRSPLKSGVLMGHAPALIEPGRATVGSLLASIGYRTAAIGKWHLGLGWRHKDGRVWSAFVPGDPLRLGDAGIDFQRRNDRGPDFGTTVDYTAPFTGGPIELGFDRFFGMAGSLDMPPYAFLSQDRTVGLPSREKQYYLDEQRPGLQVDGWDEHKVDLRFTSEAVAFIDAAASAGEPFFLYFAPSAPHRPQVPPAFCRGSTAAGPRGDSVAFVDWMVGQLMAALERNGLVDDTLFIFTSDNGAPTIFDDGDTTVHRPNGPWRGQKGDAWDGGHREPFVARWPGRIEAGAVCDEMFCLVDLMPTLAALAGVPPGAVHAEDGVDVSGLLVDDVDAGRPALDRAIVTHSMSGAFAIHRGRWKAVFGTGSGGGFSEPYGERFSAANPYGQLYDTHTDPGETTNLWDVHPDLVEDLYQHLMDVCGDPASGLAFDVELGASS